MPETRTSFCRLCINMCPVLVDVDDGVLTHITGDPDNPLYEGYTCTKGRAQLATYRATDRLTRSLKRVNGEFVEIPTNDALDEIAARLLKIIDRHGPRAVGLYTGTYAINNHPATVNISNGFMDAIGSPMHFTPATIDQPGKFIAMAFHGMWQAPPQKFDAPGAILLVGTNPLVSYQGMPFGNPGTFLKACHDRGTKLIVVDPRRTDVAKRAAIHLSPIPGEDVAILTSMIRFIIDSDLYDERFVREEASGLDVLRRHVEPFTLEEASRRAGVDPDMLAAAARTFASADRGYAAAGTGPNMSGPGTLLEYLVLCLETLCGHWLRAGELVRAAPTFFATAPKAQATPPWPPYGFGEHMRVHGLTETVAGIPTGVAQDEMLLEGDGRVRALLSCGGNPVLAWPDQLKTIQAFDELELLVQVDVQMSATARLADYVIPVKKAFEMPGFSILVDVANMVPAFGITASHAQYTDAVVDPPPDSDLVEDWEFFYELARRMGLPLQLRPDILFPVPAVDLDMTERPTNDELFELMTSTGRVPLDEVRRHPHGAFFPDPAVTVAPKDVGWEGRLELGASEMMRDLDEYAVMRTEPDADFPMRLISRRTAEVYNTASDDPQRKRKHNPAFVNPDDLVALGLASGDPVTIRSSRGAINAVVQAEPGVRPGVVSMSHGFGDVPEHDADFLEIGSCTARLVDGSVFPDRYSGQPRMSNVPIRIEPLVIDPSSGEGNEVLVDMGQGSLNNVR